MYYCSTSQNKHVLRLMTHRAMIQQGFIPDLLSEGCHTQLSEILKDVDGLSLSNFLGARVFNDLVRAMFDPALESHSQRLVERVRQHMQKVLKALCEQACASHSTRLKDLTSNSVEDFLDSKENEATAAVSNLCQAELEWIWTQNDQYMQTVRQVQALVVTRGVGHAAGGVPADFVQKIISSVVDSDRRNVLELQVR